MDIIEESDALQKTLMTQAENYAQYMKDTLGEDIVKIVLFGTVAKKNANSDSDIDILIIHLGDSNFEKRLDAESFNFMMKAGAPIECLTYEYFDAKYNPSYFLKYNLEHGVVLFMKNEDELKRREIEGYVKLSVLFEKDARDSFERDRIRAAIDLGYNSIELKIKALLLRKLDDLPGSHGGLISKFGEIYIITKEYEEEIGKKLHKALRLRNKARYDPQADLTTENCSFILSFISELSNLLK
ncbi:MAG: HEPN domain-containing protein [Candidatus Helarchaeota archaeon]|nr:HEPN domain-containing protein [Candidatus Helarchaeota archaeon]